MNSILRAAALSIVVAVSGSMVAAQDFDKGVEAYDAGDFETAFNELEPIAEQGFNVAQFYLGQMYMAGQGVTKDQIEAERWLRLSAEQDFAMAQLLLGLMYSKSEVIEQDEAEAVYWFKLAAEQDLPFAQAILGERYQKGKGVPQDYAEAARLYRLAADMGLAMAQLKLGWLYEVGKGVIQDHQTAHMWYNVASANGDKDAGEYRDRLAEKMTPAAIEEAQSRARVCMSSNYQECG